MPPRISGRDKNGSLPCVIDNLWPSNGFVRIVQRYKKWPSSEVPVGHSDQIKHILIWCEALNKLANYDCTNLKIADRWKSQFAAVDSPIESYTPFIKPLFAYRCYIRRGRWVEPAQCGSQLRQILLT
ncbi:hypothetical protein WI77_31145 [Burkholderia ubonensis]|nr:hypothetical protein WI77_31145 [Burkholderia ubonensis]